MSNEDSTKVNNQQDPVRRNPARRNMSMQSVQPAHDPLQDMIRRQHEFEQWRTQESERLHMKKEKLYTQKKQIEQERMQLNLEKRHFLHQQEFQETRQKNEEQLLEMKRQILERELYKLAEEKKLFEQKKDLFDKAKGSLTEDIRKVPSKIHGAIFFAGVNSRSALKKRYKDLLKIYHPDNKCGDTDTIQAINREYERLLKQMEGK